ncbi:MAG: Kelch repeat-containing protein [Planctomycetota bacterium]
MSRSLGGALGGAALALLLALRAGPAAAEPEALLAAEGVAALESSVSSPPLLLEALASFGGARCGDWLYVYSGHAGKTHSHSRDDLSPVFARLSLLDGRTWEHLPCPQPLQSAALVAHGGRLLRVGGMGARNERGAEADLHSVDTVASYDPIARRWEALPALPEPRSSHGAVVLGDRLYVLGGWLLAGERQVWHETAWVLDLAAKEPAWQALPKPPFPHLRALGLAAADGKLVVVGGMNGDGEPARGTWLFDPQAGSWSKGPALPFAGFGAAALGLGREVYASGLDSRLFRLAFTGGDLAWEDAGSLIFPRYFHQLVPLGTRRLLAVGGVTRPERSGACNVHLRTTEVLELGPRSEPRLTGWTVPSPGAAKNRQGVVLWRDALWAWGGNDSLGQHDFGPEHFLAEGLRLELGTLRWERAPEMPVRRQSMVTTLVAGAAPRALAVGGFGHTGQGTSSFPEVLSFDLKARKWTESALRLPGPRTQFGLAAQGEELWVFGGLDYDSRRPRGESFRFPTEVLRSRGGAAFEPAATLPQPRRAFGGALLGGRYYLVGGMKAGFELVTDVDVLDLAQGTWSKVRAPAAPRISPQLVAVGGKLYLLGGSTPRDGDSFAPNQRIEVYDPARGEWATLIERLPFPVTHLQAFAWGERILCYSVHTPGARAARVLVIEP